MRSLAILLVLSATASAEPSLVARGSSEAAPRYAIAVNNPLAWIPSLGVDNQPSFGLSAYVAVTDHVVLRGNVASYSVDGRLHNFPYGECGSSGNYTDVGVSAQFYLFRRLDGVFVEAGTLRRDLPVSDYQCDLVDDIPEVKSHSTAYGGVALAGWSYARSHFFFSVSAGLAVLHTTGEATSTSIVDYKTMTTEPISQTDPSFEWNLRIGTSF